MPTATSVEPMPVANARNSPCRHGVGVRTDNHVAGADEVLGHDLMADALTDVIDGARRFRLANFRIVMWSLESSFRGLGAAWSMKKTAARGMRSFAERKLPYAVDGQRPRAVLGQRQVHVDQHDLAGERRSLPAFSDNIFSASVSPMRFLLQTVTPLRPLLYRKAEIATGPSGPRDDNIKPDRTGNR